MNVMHVLGALVLGAGLASGPAAASTFWVGHTVLLRDTVPQNGIFTYQFTLAPGGTFLDITTSDTMELVSSSGGAGSHAALDTEIGLFAGVGDEALYVDSADVSSGGDDDDGLGSLSTLSYGAGSGLALGDIADLGGDGAANGEDGAMLAPGVYTIAVGGNSTIFTDGPTLGDIRQFGQQTMEVRLKIYSDAPLQSTGLIGPSIVPLPAAAPLLLLGLAGLALLRRRRAA